MSKTQSSTKLIAGIDGDVLVYRAAFKAQFPVYSLVDETGDVLKTAYKKKHIEEWQELAPQSNTTITKEFRYLNPKYATKALKDAVNIIKKNTKADDVVIYLSGDTNFRIDAATIRPYKGNRKAERPLAYDDVRDYIINNYPHKISDYCEADDLLSIALTKSYKKTIKSQPKEPTSPTDFILCTIDKDLDTVPGYHYNIATKKIYWVDETQAAYFFYKQMLTGDTVDNIQGIHGIGKITADSILSAQVPDSSDTTEKCIANYEIAVIDRYKAHYDVYWLINFLEIGRLLHMQRYPDELWVPKTILT